MENIEKIIKSRILHKTDFEYSSDTDKIKLSNKIVLFNNNQYYCAIPLSYCLTYPIIYDKFTTVNNKIIDVSIVVCPLTLHAIILEGLYEFVTYENDVFILRDVNDINSVVPININLKLQSNNFIQNIKRFEIKILTLKSAILYVPDMLFLTTNKPIEYIINLDYYTDTLDIDNKEIDSLIHPKSLVYVIHYKSFNDDVEKNSILLCKDINENEFSGYDTKKSKLFDYIDKYQNKIIEREGFLIPVFWYYAKNIYPDAKIIYI